MSFKSRRPLRTESLEPRMMLAGDALNLAESCAASLHGEDGEAGYIVGDANRDGSFDQLDISSVLEAGKYATGEPAGWSEGDWNRDEVFDQKDLILALQSWPDLISLPVGFEPKDIEVGQGDDFFVGATSWSSLLAPRYGLEHPVSELAGAIYKGNLCTGEGQILVPPNPDNPRPVLGLSYDSRTDYLFAAVGDPTTPNQGIAVFNGTTGEMIDEVTLGDGLFLSNILVTESAVFATSTNRGNLFKMPLDEGGKLPSTLAFESIDMTGYDPPDRPWLWGLAGAFDGKELVVIDGLNGTGDLYRVNTANGASTKIEIHGAQKTFELGDELYLSDRTLYIMQVFANSVAVVQLSDDLTEGTFVTTIECGECRSPHSIAAFGDSLYAVNSNVLSDAEAAAEDRIFGDSATIQSDVVKLPKVPVESDLWPDLISLPVGFEPKDIEVGQGDDFFVGATSWSSLLAPRYGLEHPVSELAGAIYKGNLSTGEGQILVPPNPDNPRPVLGLSYDSRTDYLYAAVGDPTTPNQGIAVFNGTTGEMIDEVTIGDDLFLSNVLVTESAVFATSTNRGDLFKMPLDEGGKLPSTLAFESIEMTGYDPPDRPWLWGLAGAFDGKELVVIDGLNGTGDLYRVNTANGASTKIEIHGAQKTFELGDELYLSDRTLYIMQVFANSVAVVQLSDDLTEGTFVTTIECGECRSPHSIAAFGDSLYAVNSNVLSDAEAAAEDRIFGDSAEIQSDVIKLPKVPVESDLWPDLISLPVGLEPKDIEVGQGDDFFVGATSWSSLLAPRYGLEHPVSELAGAIYKGNLSTGEGQILVPPNPDNPRPVLGLSYDSRTDYLFAAVGDPTTPNQGIAVFNGTTGEMIDEVTIGDDLFLSNVLVTESAVFATSTNRGNLFKMPLDEGGKLPSTLAFESIEMTGYDPPDRPWLWGLAGAFDGKELVVIDGLNGTGDLYRVNTANGASTKIEIHGAQKTFELGDELYLSDRTLYIMQVFANSVAVVQLSDDLTEGTFVKTIECGECRSPHSIAAFGDSLYAVNSNVLSDAEAAAEDRIFGDSATIQSEVVRVDART